MAGDRLRVLPALFHLMWQRQLAADLAVPLACRPSCTCAGPGERRTPTAGQDRRPDPAGFQNSATGSDSGFYAARSYSLTRPPRTGRRWIRSLERSEGGCTARILD